MKILIQTDKDCTACGGKGYIWFGPQCLEDVGKIGINEPHGVSSYGWPCYECMKTGKQIEWIEREDVNRG